MRNLHKKANTHQNHKIVGGYISVNLTQLAWALMLRMNKTIAPRHYRVYLAMIELDAVRRLSLTKHGHAPGFEIEVLARLLGWKSSLGGLTSIVKKLRDVGLIAPSGIHYYLRNCPEDVLRDTEFISRFEKLAGMKMKYNDQRKVVLPRRQFKQLLKISSPNMTTYDFALFINIRCLRIIDKKTVRTSGAFKKGDFMEAFKRGSTATNKADKHLEDLGFYESVKYDKDKRDGNYRYHYVVQNKGKKFTVNHEWPNPMPGKEPELSTDEELSTKTEGEELPEYDPISPEYEGLLQDHNLLILRIRINTTATQNGMNLSTEGLPPPDINKIRLEDLVFLDRATGLHKQHCAKHKDNSNKPKGLVAFLAHCAKALRMGVNPPDLMRWYVNDPNSWTKNRSYACDEDTDTIRKLLQQLTPTGHDLKKLTEQASNGYDGGRAEQKQKREKEQRQLNVLHMKKKMQGGKF